MQKFLHALILAIVCFSLSGCGGGSSTAPGGASDDEVADYLAQHPELLEEEEIVDEQ